MDEISQQISSIEKEIRKTPYHKGTEHHIGKLRARLARLKDKEIETALRKTGGGGGGGGGYAIKKQGDATVVLVGPPSSGKSTLINALTNAESRVAPYAFTTVTVIPGMLKYKDAYIQILDVPGLIEGAKEGKGRGKEVLSVARGADLLVIITDVLRQSLIPKMVEEIQGVGIRINKKKPGVFIEKKVSGGIIIHSNFNQEYSKETVKEVSNEFGIKNADITLKEKLLFDDLVDSFSQNRVYVPALFVVNKVDEGMPRSDRDDSGVIKISAKTGIGLDKFKDAIWNALGLTRIYLIGPLEEPNTNSPMIVRERDTLKDVALKIWPENSEPKKFAKIWGPVASFPGQEMSLSAVVQEDMQVKFI